MGIRDILSKFPYEVSGGQKQRCACARALINEPKLILADEPTGALDSKSSRLLLETMSDINKKMQATILMVTCADMFLSVLLKSKKLKYKSDNLFVARTFASKARTMGFTFGTLSMLILLSLLCLNFSSINKGVYQSTMELKGRIREALIKMILGFDIEDMDLEPEE